MVEDIPNTDIKASDQYLTKFDFNNNVLRLITS